jgi:hypothetical protein
MYPIEASNVPSLSVHLSGNHCVVDILGQCEIIILGANSGTASEGKVNIDRVEPRMAGGEGLTATHYRSSLRLLQQPPSHLASELLHQETEKTQQQQYNIS